MSADRPYRYSVDPPAVVLSGKIVKRHTDWLEAACDCLNRNDRSQSAPDPVDVCAACSQSVLTTPDDPPATLLCDVCLASLERRRSLRPGTIAADPPQGGLF